MARARQLPCDGDGICMLCKERPADEDKLICKTCYTPWHVSCLAVRPETLASTLQWECPDCTMPAGGDGGAPVASDELVAAIRAIEADTSLTELEKAKKRQELLTGRYELKGKKKVQDWNEVLRVFGKGLTCSICLQLPERPVTTPCGHNFCLKCFQKWIGQGKRTCVKCRRIIPPKMANHPRINSGLVVAIRTAKMSKSNDSIEPDKLQYFVSDQDRPDKAYTTERAKRAGKANAASGKIFVTVPPDHFGPILAENDPERNQGVLVGEWWEDRLECRQWGVHRPHVAGIAGQTEYGAQSVVLSGGYQDDEDHGEWFLYTGSGGRDLSGNRRTNKDQSFDQTFSSYNQALRLSCEKGYPVRVVRSYKEKRSSYAPEKGVRYDGIYRIEKCWQKVGKQGFKVCRYLFVRCDNSPAPWTSDLHGDKVRALPTVSELKKATDITERKESPSWDYHEKENRWKWQKPPPRSQIRVATSRPQDGEQRKIVTRKVQKKQNISAKEKVLKEFACLLCKKVMTLPMTTPCGHNFCKSCLEGAFAGQTFERRRTCLGGRTLRSRKNVMMCPSCPTDISEFLRNPEVNREVESVIKSLTNDLAEEQEENEEDEQEAPDSKEEKSDSVSVAEDYDIPNAESGNKRKRKENDSSLLTEQNPEKSCKQKKPKSENGFSKIDEAGEGNDEAKIAVDNGNDSPSSPLNVQTDDDFQ